MVPTTDIFNSIEEKEGSLSWDGHTISEYDNVPQRAYWEVELVEVTI